mmetsp:Transcript_19323/g.49635  ORF Transcript_19323/g.49635 Transcript_19323/m.49635 type:complete len:177 (+) Transcript_19323:143-673(+)|eukprot:jgi/Tetstr1/434457/TSEL_023557.t1
MARTGRGESLRELRSAMETQSAELKSAIDVHVAEARLPVADSGAGGSDDRSERAALLRRKRLQDAASRADGTWSYGWVLSIIFGCATVAVLLCLVLFTGTPADAKAARKMAIRDEALWEQQVEETYGDKKCPRPDNFPIECNGRAWAEESRVERCMSLFMYRGWDVPFLKICGLIK